MPIQKILYPLSNALLMNFIKFWSLGGGVRQRVLRYIYISVKNANIYLKPKLYKNICEKDSNLLIEVRIS